MRIAVSSDERTGVADTVLDALRARGHDPVAHGALAEGARACALTSEAALDEILDAWFAAAPSEDADDRANVEHLADIERHG